MLYIQDTIVKLGGIPLPGQIKSIEIQEVASIDEIENDQGTAKSNQPTGYDSAKVMIDIRLENTAEKTVYQQIQEVERLFRTEGQKVSNLIEIICDDCTSRGITNVYFKNFTTKRVISESIQVASMELWTPMIAEIKTKKAAASSSGSGSGGGSGSGSKKSGSTKSDKQKVTEGKKILNNFVSNTSATATTAKNLILNSPVAQDLRNTNPKKALDFLFKKK